MKSKKGISLIVLIVTIIVIIILAAVVILTINKNNPIESAKEATFKEDVRTFQDELAMSIATLYKTNPDISLSSVTLSSYEDIIKYVPSFTKKYSEKLKIQNGKIVGANKLSDKEKEYLTQMNISVDGSQAIKVYSVGEQVRLKDGNNWRVVKNNDDNYITLIRENFLTDTCQFDSNTEYGYTSSHIEWVLNNEYLPTLKQIQGMNWDGNSSVRLLAWEEYTALKETEGSSSWLYGEGKYWWCTRMYGLRALVYPDGSINDDNSNFSNYVRPVIVTLKNNIVL